MDATGQNDRAVGGHGLRFQWFRERGDVYFDWDWSVEDVNLIRESGLPKDRILACVDCSAAQTKDVLYATSILVHKLTPLVSGVYARVKDTKSVTKDFLDTLKICSGVVVVENDNIVPLTEIKRLQDLHVQWHVNAEYLGKSIVHVSDPIVRMVCTQRLW